MRDTSKAWLVKVDTDLRTRLLVVIEPHLLVEDLQAAIEHDHRAAYPGCGSVKCQLLYVLEVVDGRDIPSSVHSRYRLQDVLRRDGARVYAEFADKAAKYTACQHSTPHQPLQIALSPEGTTSDGGNRGLLGSPAEHASQRALPLNGPATQPLAAAASNKRSSPEANGAHSHEQPAQLLDGPCTQPHAPAGSKKRALSETNEEYSQEQAVKKGRLSHEGEARAGRATGAPRRPHLPASHSPQPGSGHRAEPLQGLSQRDLKAATASHKQHQAPQANIMPDAPQQPAGIRLATRELGAVQRERVKALESPAERDGSSKEESLGGETPSGEGWAIPGNAEQRKLCLQAQTQQHQQQQGGVPVQAADHENTSSGSEASSSSSEDEDSPEPPPSKAAPEPQPALPSTALQCLQPVAAPSALQSKGQLEAAAATDDSTSEDEPSSPELEGDAPKLAWQSRQAGMGMLQNGRNAQAASSSNSSGEDDGESAPGQQAADKATGKPAAASQKDAALRAEEQHLPITRSTEQRAKQHGASNGPAAARKGEKAKRLAPEQAAPPVRALAAPPVAGSPGHKSKHAEVHNGAAPAAAGRDTRSRAARQATPAQQQEAALEAAKRQSVYQGSPQQQQWLAGATHAAMADESSSSSEDERQEEPRAWPAVTGKADAAHAERGPSSSQEAGTPRNAPDWLSRKELDMLKEIPLEALLKAKVEWKRQNAAQQPGTQGGDARADGNTAPGIQTRSSALSQQALLSREVEKSEAAKAAQEAKTKQNAQGLFSKEPGEFKGIAKLKKDLMKGLPVLVGYEQGLTLKDAAAMFRDAKKPPWWPLEKWGKGQMDRVHSVLLQMYTAAQKPALAMRKAQDPH